MIKHNNTTYSGRITDAGQSVFLETPKISIEMLHFSRPGNFAAARRRGPLRVRAPAPGGPGWDSVKSLVCDTGLGVRVAAAGQSLALSPSLSPSDGAGWPAAAADRNGVSSHEDLHALAVSFHSSWCSGSHCGYYHSTVTVTGLQTPRPPGQLEVRLPPSSANPGTLITPL